MLRRRGGRPVFALPLLLWAPCFYVGLWLLMGMQVDTVRSGRGEWIVIVSLAAPGLWFSRPAGLVGAGLTLLGLFLLFFAAVRPGPRSRLVVARYGAFAAAGHLLLLAALLSVFKATQSLATTQPGGFSLRFIATMREGLANQLTPWALAAFAALAYVLSLGRASSLGHRGGRRPAPAAPPAVLPPATVESVTVAAAVHAPPPRPPVPPVPRVARPPVRRAPAPRIPSGGAPVKRARAGAPLRPSPRPPPRSPAGPRRPAS